MTMWMEAVVPCFKVLYKHLPENTEENREKLTAVTTRNENRAQDHPHTKQEY
jgi:hypothetical protein